MDSITHIALGSVIGEVMLGKQLGKKALAIGALAQSVPDIDFIASFWLPPAENLIAHRGFTHSFLFAGIVTVLLALLADRWHRRQSVFFSLWALFFGVQITIHLLIDGFNAYGVGWFEPFSKHRISFNTLFVADPFFSIWTGAAFVALIFLRKESRIRIQLAKYGLLLSGLYLCYALIHKAEINSNTKEFLQLNGISYQRYFSTPTPLNNWLWYIVAEDDTGFYIGYRSVFDTSENIALKYFLRNDSLLRVVDDHESLQRLKRFSQGFYTVEFVQDTLVFNDLRFGQMAGWHDPRARFVFHYYLEHADHNDLVIQRGRFANWNKETVRSLIRRIRGD